ncbi:MAG: hypothetical protein IK116_07070 [Firmicutes bacterium]|nr:hypothetical protein [Bacillota bacterium]
MNQLYQIDTIVLPSLGDAAGRLDCCRAFGLFMDLAALHSEQLGAGICSMLQRDLFWLAVRTHARFYRRPRVGERVTLQTWPERPGKAHCVRNYRILQGDEVLAAAKTDWAVLKISDQTLAPVDVLFPPELTYELGPALTERFAAPSRKFGPENVCGSYRVRERDLDMGGHVNNAAYLPIVLELLDPGLLPAELHEIDLGYRKPCFEGDELTLCCRPVEQGLDLALLKEGEPAFLARLA